VHGPNPARGYRPLVIAAFHAQPAETAAAWRLGPSGETARVPATTHARRARSHRGPRVRWRARRRPSGGKPAARCTPGAPVGSQGGTRHGGGGRGAPERWADGEAAQMASGGGVQRRRGSSDGHRQGFRGPVAQGRPGGEEAAVD
jgi:hypothetical protein